jgi:alcohol dehydrogenase
VEKNSLAGVLEAPGKMTLKEFPLPDIGPDAGLLKVEMVGICSTDVKIYQGKITHYPLPLIMGHEMVGRIARIGSNAARRWGVKEGDRVVLEASTSCGACEPCITGNYRFCESPLGYGLKTSCNVPPHLWGAYSQYMYIAHGSVVFPIKESVPLKEAALITGVIANGVQWICLLGQIKVGDRILIQGMGVQGLGSIVAAREAGAKEIVICGLGGDRDRFDLARRLGADHVVNIEEADLPSLVDKLTGGKGVDIVMDVTGRPESIALALEAVRKQGTIVEAGLIGGNASVPFALDRMVQKELRLQGARSKGYQATAAAVSIVESGKYPLGEMVTAEYPLSECATAMRVAAGETGAKPLKVMLKP